MLSLIKTVMIGLTAIRDGEAPGSALAYGLSLAAAAHAHADIRAHAVRLILPSGYIYDAGADLLASENERILAAAQRYAADARQIAERAGVSAEVSSSLLLYDDVSVDLVAHGRVADVSVVDAGGGIAEIDRGLIEALLFESGRPVIVVPPQAKAFAAGSVVIAWDGSARAARAVTDAMPFLKMAANVRVVTVHEPKKTEGAMPGADLATALARHGLPVTLTPLAPDHGDVGAALVRHLSATDTDLLVMGAYAHSRLWQMILGGVTQTMLEKSPVPVLMSY